MALATKRSCSPSRSPSPSPVPPPNLSPGPSTQPSQSKIRFLILSDTHDHQLLSYPECDVLLHCGDLTEDGTPNSIKAALDHLATIPAVLKLIMPGNHEISLDKDYWLSQGGDIAQHREAKTTCDLIQDLKGEDGHFKILEEGTHTFTLRSGATFTIFASPYTPRYGASAFQYETKEDRYNPASTTPPWGENVSTERSCIPEGVDIVMTHGPPKYILDATPDGRSAGCEHLRRAIARVKPKLHCFGHIHSGYGAQRIEFSNTKEEDEDGIKPLEREWVGKNQAKRKGYACLPPGSVKRWEQGGQTLCVNAAIQDANREPSNMPWLVDMEFGGRTGHGFRRPL